MSDLRAAVADSFVGRCLSDFRWFRRWVGGAWERWYLDVIHADVWFRRACDGSRPCAIARGVPSREVYP